MNSTKNKTRRRAYQQAKEKRATWSPWEECEVKLPGCQFYATDNHHIVKRRARDESCKVKTCRVCHQKIELRLPGTEKWQGSTHQSIAPSPLAGGRT